MNTELIYDEQNLILRRLWDYRHDIDPAKFLQSYLFRIAKNLTYDLFHKIARDKKNQADLIA